MPNSDSSNTLPLKCPKCSKSICVPNSMRGKSGKCPSCGTGVKIPLPKQLKNQPVIMPSLPVTTAPVHPAPLNPRSPNTYTPRLVFRLFLGSFLVCIFICAILAIYSLLFWDMSEFQGRVMLTTLAVGVYSLTGLCGTALLNYRLLKFVGFTCIVASIVGAAFAVSTNWIEGVGLELLLKGRISFFIVSLALAHVSLICLMQSKNAVLVSAKLFTIAAISVLAIMLLLVTQSPDTTNISWRPIFILGVLVSLGSVCCPVLSIMTRTNPAQE